MLKPVEDLTDEELDKRLAVTYPGMDVSELPDNAYVLPTGPPGAALPLPDSHGGCNGERTQDARPTGSPTSGEARIHRRTPMDGVRKAEGG